MDNRLLIGFFVFLAAFLVLPIVVQQVRQANAPETAAGNAETPARPPAQNSELNQPPLLNEGNIIGTEWEVQVEQYRIKISVAAGGLLYATHPLAKAITGMDYLEGRWRIEYDKMHVMTAFGGREYHETLKISGMDLYYTEGDRHEKVRRF